MATMALAHAQGTQDSYHCAEDAFAEQQAIAKDETASDDVKFKLQETLLGDALKIKSATTNDPPAYLRTCLDRKHKLMSLNIQRSSPALRDSFRMQALLGQIEDLNGRNEEALRHYRLALAKSPHHYPTLRRAYDAWTKKQMEDFIQADIRQLDAKRLNTFIEQSNDFAKPILAAADAPRELKISVLETRARLLSLFKRESEAMLDYQRVLEVDPNHVKSLRTLAEFERSRNRPAELRKYLEKLAPLVRNDLETQLNLLALEFRDEDAQAMLSTAMAAERAHPNQNDVQAYRGYALSKTGRAPEGEKLIAEVLKREPKNKVARATMAGFRSARAQKLKEDGQPGGALAEYTEALKLNPDDLKLRERMALFLYDFHKAENFQPAEASKKDLDRALDLLDPVLKQDYVNQGTLQVYVASAARCSTPKRGAPVCDRYEKDYGSAPDTDFVLDCAGCYRAAGNIARARALLESSMKLPKYQSGSGRLMQELRKF